MAHGVDYKAKIHYTSFPVTSPQRVRNKLAASRLRRSCRETCMDFGLYQLP